MPLFVFRFLGFVIHQARIRANSPGMSTAGYADSNSATSACGTGKAEPSTRGIKAAGGLGLASGVEDALASLCARCEASVFLSSFFSSLFFSVLGALHGVTVALHGVTSSEVGVSLAFPAVSRRFRSRCRLTRSAELLSSRSLWGWRFSHERMQPPAMRGFFPEHRASKIACAAPSGMSNKASATSGSNASTLPRSSS